MIYMHNNGINHLLTTINHEVTTNYQPLLTTINHYLFTTIHHNSINHPSIIHQPSINHHQKWFLG